MMLLSLLQKREENWQRHYTSLRDFKHFWLYGLTHELRHCFGNLPNTSRSVSLMPRLLGYRNLRQPFTLTAVRLLLLRSAWVGGSLPRLWRLEQGSRSEQEVDHNSGVIDRRP
ncbi:MAG: hypothetical protein F4X84_03680 [Synechococcus sp. SB0662_bin_45]|nr:hypothetical protein [Synechococcus sp. SB0662_bin_45]